MEIENIADQSKLRRLKEIKIVIGVGILLLLCVILFGFWLTRAPAAFPVDEPVTIAAGSSVTAIADHLAEEDVVRSGGLLYMVLLVFYDPKIQAGTYFFTERLSVFEVANHLVSNTPTEELISLTLPEGFTVKEFAKIATQAELEEFDAEAFVANGEPVEGFLFPDTYYVPKDFTDSDLIELLDETYEEKTKTLRVALENHHLGEYGVITLASLLEREANDTESMRQVAGVLLNRLEIGMRLQADASLEYVLNKSLGELTADDLKLDSPYNTYLYDGLPPTPIGNPGLAAINAVLDPIESDYYYYLTDEDGEFHFARTFDEHTDNIAKYLK